MELTEPKGRDTGSEFVKKLRPIGCVLVLLCFAGFLILCFTSGKSPLKDYECPQDAAYYAAHTEELVQELQDNVLPRLPGVLSCEAQGGKALITVENQAFFETRKALLEYFDEDLLELRQAHPQEGNE